MCLCDEIRVSPVFAPNVFFFFFESFSTFHCFFLCKKKWLNMFYGKPMQIPTKQSGHCCHCLGGFAFVSCICPRLLFCPCISKHEPESSWLIYHMFLDFILKRKKAV